MATKVLLASAMLWSFFTHSEAELTVIECVGDSFKLQVNGTNITCTGFKFGENVFWIVTGESGGLQYTALCKYSMPTTKSIVCSPRSATYNTSLNQYGNSSELTVDLSNISESHQINVTCYTNTALKNCIVQLSPENKTTTTTTVQTTSTTRTTAASKQSAPSTTPPSPPPPPPPPTATPSPTSTTTTAPTTSRIKEKDTITTETTHVTSAASTATADNTSSWTTDRVTATEGTMILDQAEVAAIAGGVAAFVALLVVLVVIVLVCRRRVSFLRTDVSEPRSDADDTCTDTKTAGVAVHAILLDQHAEASPAYVHKMFITTDNTLNASNIKLHSQENKTDNYDITSEAGTTGEGVIVTPSGDLHTVDVNQPASSKHSNLRTAADTMFSNINTAANSASQEYVNLNTANKNVDSRSVGEQAFASGENCTGNIYELLQTGQDIDDHTYSSLTSDVVVN